MSTVLSSFLKAQFQQAKANISLIKLIKPMVAQTNPQVVDDAQYHDSPPDGI